MKIKITYLFTSLHELEGIIKEIAQIQKTVPEADIEVELRELY